MKSRFAWSLTLDTTPDRLWRYIADTNRINQYAGLPEFAFHYVPDPEGGSHQVGETRYMGLRLQWDEHPFEWIEGRYFSVIRAYHNGPIRRFHTEVRLTPKGNQTLLEQTLEFEPRWIFAVPALWWEVGVVSRRRFEAAYRKIEQFLKGEVDVPLLATPKQFLPHDRVELFRMKLEKAAGFELFPRLIQDIETLDDESLDRMRPFAFADRWQVDRRQTLKLFLHAAQAGLLDLSWDVICPGCRGASERHTTLRNLRQEAHCPACNIKYDAEFSQKVELTFRPNALVRRVEVVRYCSGGPMNSPHTVVQQTLGAGESRTLELNLTPSQYIVRSLKLNGRTKLATSSSHVDSTAQLSFSIPELTPETLAVKPAFTLRLNNGSKTPVTISIERTATQEDAATAALVIAMQEFRTLFSEEVLAPDIPISVGAVTLLFTDLKSSTSMYETLGEAPAYGLVQHHFELLRDAIAKSEGTIVKTIGDAVMAAFFDPAHAVKAAFAMHQAIQGDNAVRKGQLLTLKIGIHHGPCITVNQNNLLDYFGTTANLAARLEKESAGNDIVLSDDVWRDPGVRELLQRRGAMPKSRECTVRGLSGTRTVHIIEVF